MSKNFKLQSAMEYLMTYGWAILVIAIVLVALYALGVFNGSAFLHPSCIAASGYICTNQTAVTETGANAGNLLVGLTFGQNGGSTVYNAILSLAPQSAGATSSGFPVASSLSSNTNMCSSSSGGNCALVAGGEQQVYFQVPGPEFTSGNSIGSQFSGYIWLNYSTSQNPPNNAMNAVKVATLIVKVT